MKLIIFGAGYWGEHALNYFGTENVFCFCDRKIKGDSESILNGKRIISFQKLMNIYKEKEYVIIVCAGRNFTEEMCQQLEGTAIEDYFIYQELLKVEGSRDLIISQLENDESRERLFRKYYKKLAESIKGQLEYLKRHSDITTLKPATGKLRKIQFELLDFVAEFFDFIKELDIKPFLTFGNLVGAYRHKGFIPWDDDMDFGIMRSEFEKLMEFAKDKCVIGTRNGEMWLDNSGKCMSWEEVFFENPEKYVFDIRFNMVQVYRKDFGIKNPGIDFWIYDFYKDGYDIQSHRQWVEDVMQEVHRIENEKDKVVFIERKRKENKMISYSGTEQFYPGIDNFEGYPGIKRIDKWIPTKDIFPLRKTKYENTEFWVPNQMEVMLSFEYPNVMDFPYDLGNPLHNEMDES